MKMTELKENYDNYLELHYTSKNTISSYKNCFEKFTKENNRVYRMSNSDLKEYFVTFKNRYSETYFNQMLSSARIIFKILRQPQKLKGINYLKASIQEIDILTTKEIQKSLENISNIKHQLIIKLLYVGALRISELLNLELSDIDRSNNRLVIRNSKGGRGRFVPVSNNIITDLKLYYREYLPAKYIFEGRKGGKYSATSVRSVVKKLNCKKRLYPHLLRHSSLTKLVDNGHNLLKVQRFAGHTNSKSTERYYHLSNRSLEGMTLNLS